MKITNILWAHVCHFYYTQALRQINKLHPDVPKIVHRKLHWRNEITRLYRSFS